MPRLNLTQKAIAKLPTPHPDGELRGFGVQCSGKTNQELFIAQRDLPSGKTRRVTVGAFSGLALSVAKKRAEDVLDELRRGIDPKHKVATFTQQKALDDYLAARPHLRPASMKLYRMVERVLETWLDRDLKEITPEMVEKPHREIGKEIGTSTAKLGYARAPHYMEFCRRPHLPPNPVLRLRRQWYAEPRRTRMVGFEQLQEFYRAVCALQNPVARDYVRLMLFTGMWRGEAAALRWKDVDLAQKNIRVPAEATKARRKLSRKGHVGAVAFSRTGDPATGDFSDAKAIMKFGDVPHDLSTL